MSQSVHSVLHDGCSTSNIFEYETFSKFRGGDHGWVCFPQEGIEPRAHTKQTALLEQLKTATKQHDQSELERKYAVRYHKVRSEARRTADPITPVDVPQ